MQKCNNCSIQYYIMYVLQEGESLGGIKIFEDIMDEIWALLIQMVKFGVPKEDFL